MLRPNTALNLTVQTAAAARAATAAAATEREVAVKVTEAVGWVTEAQKAPQSEAATRQQPVVAKALPQAESCWERRWETRWVRRWYERRWSAQPWWEKRRWERPW
jgi:hypothetical protein